MIRLSIRSRSAARNRGRALRTFSMTVLLACAALPVFSAPVQEAATEIVATTSWTAAFAYAAGAESVRPLAPYELQHPPEYELRPSDLPAVAEAKILLFAGYEVMMPRLRDSLGTDGPELVQIATDYSLATIEASLTTIAGKLGNPEPARRSVSEIRGFYEDWRRELEREGLTQVPVITHVFMKPILDELGANVIGVFGPAPLEARQIASLSESGAKLIVDNRHSGVGGPLRETMRDVPVVEFVNFPGVEGTRTLLDVLAYNRSRLSTLVQSD